MPQEDNLEARQHSAAHVLMQALRRIYSDAIPAVGPAISEGFYYDFDSEHQVTEADLKKIEKEMKKVVSTWTSIDGKEVTVEEAKKHFAGNPYKTEIIEEIEKKEDKITFYTSGDYTDLCAGGHSENPSKIPQDSFKLDKIAGAYWRGDEKNKMLTRIYGLAFESKKELDEYLVQREEAEKRDHRKIGKEMDLFTISPLVGPGLPLFTPKGTAMRDAITDKIGRIQAKLGYQRVSIPHITKPDLYKTSGHWEKFGDELFKVHGRDTEFVMKPMNCPHHTQIFASAPRSYKDLPIRYAENTMVYRDEQTGELIGLARVRSITQDDGHVFCRPDQIKQEVKNIIEVIRQFYTALDMYNEGTYHVLLSMRDPNNKDKYIGGDDIWEKAEGILREIAGEENLPYTEDPGGAAFYGPKLDFNFKDALGRDRQLATVQVDFNMPSRFGLEYTEKDGTKNTPVMIHRAIAGSLERFMAIIIEHFAGDFPVWLAPVQAKVIPVSEDQNEYAKDLFGKLFDAGVRVEIDNSDNNLGKKVRNAKVERVPYILIVGKKEQEEESVTVEQKDGTKVGVMKIDEAVQFLREKSI